MELNEKIIGKMVLKLEHNTVSKHRPPNASRTWDPYRNKQNALHKEFLVAHRFPPGDEN